MKLFIVISLIILDLLLNKQSNKIQFILIVDLLTEKS